MARRPTTPIEMYKLANGEKRYRFNTYLGRDPLTGKEKRTSRRGFKSKKEAELGLSRLKLEVANGTFRKQRIDTFQEIYDIWIQQYAPKVEESTLMKTKTIFRNHILPALGDYRVEKMTIDVCQRHVDEWALKLQSVSKVKSYASNVMKFAIKRGYITSNPFEHVEVVRPKKTFEEAEEEEDVKWKFYSRPELSEFLSCAENDGNYRVYAFFRLLAFSGMRKGEALALRWADVDFENSEIKIEKALARGVGSRLYLKLPKNGEKRTLKMDNETMAILSNWRSKQQKELFTLGFNARKKDQLLFSNSSNEFFQPCKTRQWIMRIQKKHNLKRITTHGLRHTHCSLLFESGANLKEVQERLGHKDSSITLNIYTHVTAQAKAGAIQKFEQFMSG